jgi:hypothetical protein
MIEYEFHGRLNVQLYHANGQLMKNDWLDFLGQSAQFDMSGVNAGIYYLMATDENGVSRFVEKVVKL